MRKNELSVFKMEHEGFKITLKRENDYHPQVTGLPLPPASEAATAPPVVPGGKPAPSTPDPTKEITSPMVGTFYSAPSPEAGPYVSVGQEVTEDTVVCIIEAMKVMNEVKAERRGVIAEIIADNGKPVQFGQVMFRLK